VADGRIVAVGTRSEVADLIGADTQTVDVGDGCVMPGFIEAHGHPLMEALALSDRIVDAAWQLLADDVIGSPEVGKYADTVVLSADPRTVPPEQIADLDVRATFLAGRQVYQQ
ncbi:MAG TPA: amidohydrolase family protein, partial [Mycobacterium sp.]|nr:amidohydrolase family protein [Mycobacterium sp.]